MNQPEPLRTPAVAQDGTSQAQRVSAALDPGYAPIDERGLAELLGFARSYGKRLRYFGRDGAPAGDWSGFVPDDIDAEEVAAFLRDPSSFSPATHPLLFRPHFVLFLAFLNMVARAQVELNALTARHLDFYYRDVLGLQPRPSEPDRVNVLLEPAATTSAVLVPAGTLLRAPPDSAGADRAYATERDLVVTRARVAELRAVHVERRVTGFAEVRKEYRSDPVRAALEMLKLALGRPSPGDPVPLYPERRPVDSPLLIELRNLARLGEGALGLRLFEVRDLTTLWRRRLAAQAEESSILEWLATLPELSKSSFDHLPEVKTLVGLYQNRHRQDVRSFVADRLRIPSFDLFVQRMHTKVRIDAEWDAIRQLLDRVSSPPEDFRERFGTTEPARYYARVASTDLRDWTQRRRIDAIEGYLAKVEELEAHFHLKAEEFALLVDTLLPATSNEAGPNRSPLPTPLDASGVDALLTQAHRNMVYGARRAALRQEHKHGAAAMLAHALGEAVRSRTDSELLGQLAGFFARPGDRALIEQAITRPANEEPAPDWDQVYQVLEVAQRNRERLAPPQPVRIEWLNVHATADPAAAAGSGGAGGGWKTLGVPPPADRAKPPAPNIGWAISSPLFDLAEGARRIDVKLKLATDVRDAGGALADAFAFEVSTADGWLPVAAAVVADAGSVEFQLAIEPGQPAIAPMAEDASGIATRWPLVRAMLRQHWDAAADRWQTHYPEAARLRVAAVRLSVEVAGLAGLTLENDESRLDPAKPFEPFGAAPRAGTKLLVGHRELATKRLDRVTFRLGWMGAPADLKAHYAGYGLGEKRFTMNVDLVDRRRPVPLGGPVEPFGTGATITVDPTAAGGDAYRPMPQAAVSGALSGWDRYFRWRLNEPDFQHEAYPRIVAEKAVQLAADIANKTVKQPSAYQVNPPYTPRLETLLVDYSASVDIDVARPAGDDQVFHLHPFGYAAPLPERSAGEATVLLVPRYDGAAELYVGLDGVRAPEAVTLLFQMVEGSGDPDADPAPVRWSYASEGRWVDLGPGVLMDGTHNLVTSGIVELALPAAAPTTLLPGGRYWLRAAVDRDTAAVADTVAVHAQAVSAVFVDGGNAPDHYAAPLPPGSITKLATPLRGIGAVRQPYTSHGGRPPEDERGYAVRVSERLRHKQRALTMWDYEHLVLERFPEIYKVRCLPAELSIGEAEPGSVTVIVIPDVRRKLPFDSFEPKAPAELLARIEEHLRARAPGPARVRVRNAHYISVTVRCAVRFTGAGSDAFYQEALAADLDRYLSPWAFEEGADIVLGGKIYGTSIVDFIERRPYVDYVANLRLFTSEAGGRLELGKDDGTGYHVAAGRPDGVLRAAGRHLIELISEADHSYAVLTGIGFMRVELDFVVAASRGKDG